MPVSAPPRSCRRSASAHHLGMATSTHRFLFGQGSLARRCSPSRAPQGKGHHPLWLSSRAPPSLPGCRVIPGFPRAPATGLASPHPSHAPGLAGPCSSRDQRGRPHQRLSSEDLRPSHMQTIDGQMGPSPHSGPCPQANTQLCSQVGPIVASRPTGPGAHVSLATAGLLRYASTPAQACRLSPSSPAAPAVPSVIVTTAPAAFLLFRRRSSMATRRAIRRSTSSRKGRVLMLR